MGADTTKPEPVLDPACVLLATLYRSCAGGAHYDPDVALALLKAANARGFDREQALHDLIAETLALTEQAIAFIDPAEVAAAMASIDPNTLAPAPAQPPVARPSFTALVREEAEHLRANGGLHRSDVEIADAIAYVDAVVDLPPLGRTLCARIVAVMLLRADDASRAAAILDRLRTTQRAG